MKTLILSIAFSFFGMFNPFKEAAPILGHADMPNLVKVEMVGDEMMPVVDLPVMEIRPEGNENLARYDATTGIYKMENDLPGIFIVAKKENPKNLHQAVNINGIWTPWVNLPAVEITAEPDSFIAGKDSESVIAGS